VDSIAIYIYSYLSNLSMYTYIYILYTIYIIIYMYISLSIGQLYISTVFWGNNTWVYIGKGTTLHDEKSPARLIKSSQDFFSRDVTCFHSTRKENARNFVSNDYWEILERGSWRIIPVLLPLSLSIACHIILAYTQFATWWPLTSNDMSIPVDQITVLTISF
jgi:hypothetical protein